MNTWSWRRSLTCLSWALLALVSSIAMAVMIVLLLSPHGFWYCSKPRQEERTKQKVLSAALEMFDSEHGDCPQALSTLVGDGVLAEHVDLADVWHHERRYVCHDDQMMIWSAGADRRFGTADDIKTTTPRADPLAP